MLEFLIDIIVLIIIIWAVDSINLNVIFKKNRPYQARTIYIIIIFSLTYLTSNFILSFMNSLN